MGGVAGQIGKDDFADPGLVHEINADASGVLIKKEKPSLP